ncbi:MAG TPA: chloride channel protein [Puia sp.]|nr:chloride channel protein [Puia sp.]
MKIVKQIRLLLKKSFDRIRNERLKRNLLQAIPFWAASLLTGILAVLYAKLFAYAERETAYILKHWGWILFIITPLCFIVAWWVVVRFSPYSRGSGIPQVMASIELSSTADEPKVSRLLSIRVIIVKMISSLVMALGGGVIGREGPTIQIAGSVFKKVYQWLPKWWPRISKQNMIMTGAASGLAAAFNTPLGGIVFAVEELTKTHISEFKTSLFTAVIIAGLTTQALLGPYLYLGYPNVNNSSNFIFFGVIAVAVVAGVSASIMSKMMLALLKWKSSFRLLYQHLLYITIAALIIITCAFFIDHHMLGSGKDLMAHALFTQDKYSAWYLPALRIGGSILSFTVGAAGGVFAPALSAGASIGSAVSGWMHLSESNANLLILSGMVGFLTGITRTPFTSTILVVEMTDRHSVILHLMLAGLVASLASYLIDRHSFYDHLKGQYLDDLNQNEMRKNKQL